MTPVPVLCFKVVDPRVVGVKKGSERPGEVLRSTGRPVVPRKAGRISERNKVATAGRATHLSNCSLSIPFSPANVFPTARNPSAHWTSASRTSSNAPKGSLGLAAV